MAGFEYTEYFTKDAISPTNPVPIVRAQNVKMGRFIENNNEAITVELSEQLLRSALYKDCLLMTFIGAGVGDTCIFHSNKRNHLAPNVAKIEPFNEHINMEYALFFFMSSLGQLGVTNISKSTAQASLSMATIRELVIPIPPIKEQSRITNEVTKWFSLIDCIEENRNNLQETIKKAKSKILDLAIHGKLVPQDPTDEPACKLLKRINPKAEITCDNQQYGKLPNGWCETTFKGIFKDVSSKPFQILQSQIKAKGKHPVISQSSNFIEGYSDENVVYECDCPIVIFGDHTRNVKYVDFDFIVGADGVKIIKPYIDAKYSYYMLVYAASHIVNKGYSRHSNQISKFGYTVPPLAEQHRIVAKIEELFGQLDKIEVSL